MQRKVDNGQLLLSLLRLCTVRAFLLSVGRLAEAERGAALTVLVELQDPSLAVAGDADSPRACEPDAAADG